MTGDLPPPPCQAAITIKSITLLTPSARGHSNRARTDINGAGEASDLRIQSRKMISIS